MLRTLKATGVVALAACDALITACDTHDEALDTQLRDAVVKYDIASVDRLLGAGARPDAPVAGGLSSLDTAFEILIDKGPWKAGDPPVYIVYRLTRSIRHRNGKVVVASGTLRPKLSNDARNVGFTMEGFELKGAKGATQAVTVAGDETSFVNVVHGQNQFPVDFNVQYTISGVMVNGKLEAEEIRAPSQPANMKSNEGIVVPLATMLPSTMDLYRPMLKKKGFVK